ncbi:hypothetical protein [Leucobacter massiliensis]|uniref:DUF2207 domain-containing protein n=1 Tax=Leucobacter massiliensis TaxID=1686285 RepID=A0A2S9QP52_9MICO|nr:hypothetical protein [Leucobacter massiliensis]PRI11364.1 hypothetical protein B4915_09280 [Leucobacter massiliensis]
MRRGRRRGPRRGSEPGFDPFDLAGSDPELLNSGRIPDPQPAHTPLFAWLARILTAVEARLRARGDATVRNAIRALWAIVALVGAFLLVGPIVNEPLDIDDVLASAKIDEVDWIASDARIDYAVSRDPGGRFAVTGTEHYTANFTNGPEARIERVFPTEFQGRDTGFELSSATVDGQPAEVELRRGATVTRVLISPPGGERFEGSSEIELSFALRDLVTEKHDDATGTEVERWSWDLLGASWPQATKGLAVSVTLTPELDAALLRAPRAHVGWLLIGGTAWLSPEAETAEGVRYAFTNDDTLPPYPDLVIDLSFERGTFTLPATTALFWWQSWGPLLPLAVLGVFALFALAARRVVWADSAGEPWYLPRAEPPDELTAAEAAQLRQRPWHAELIDALSRGVPPRPGRKRRKERAEPPSRQWLTAVARAGMRAGRLGNLPSVLRRQARWDRDDRAVAAELRWVPDSYVRDSFIFGSLAIALLQWGLLRQLSHQVMLTVVWWPALFVLCSTVLALLTVWAVWRPRPLTRAGALAMQQLKGIDAYARATRLVDRGPVDDPLLPYALLGVGPRRGGRGVARLAAQESGDRWLWRGWRTEHFVSMPAILALLLALATLAAAIFTVSTRPSPYEQAEFVTWPSSNAPGAIWAQIEGFDIAAELDRDEQAGARLSVTERLRVRFTPGGSSVPQLAREWPRERLGQSLGLAVESVRVDGEEVPFAETAGAHTTAMVTRMSEVRDGPSDVEVRYTLSRPVVDAPDGPDSQQQLRWAAALGFWEDSYYTNPANPFDGSAPVRPLRVELTVAPELVAEIRTGGWIASDRDAERVPAERGNGFRPWVSEQRVYLGEGLEDSVLHDLRIGEERNGGDGSLIVSLDADAVQSRVAEDLGSETPAGPWGVSEEINAGLEKYELDLTGDLGAVLNFPAGTFSNVDVDGYERYRSAYQLPYATVLALAGAVAAASAGTFVFALRLRRRASASLRTIAFGAIPLAAAAQCVLFCWALLPMPGGDQRIWGGVWLGALMLTGVFAQMIMVGRRSGTVQNGPHDAP